MRGGGASTGNIYREKEIKPAPARGFISRRCDTNYVLPPPGPAGSAALRLALVILSLDIDCRSLYLNTLQN